MTNKEIASKAIDDIARTLDKFVLTKDEVSQERKDAVQNIIDTYGERYFLAPASGKEAYHGAFPGGLAAHSMKVTERIFQLCAALGCDDITDDTKTIVGIFHDIGKIGTHDGDPYYIEETSDWHRNNLGQMYKNNYEISDGLKNHAQRSVKLLTQAGLHLNDEEYASILLHDGMYLEENVSHFKSLGKLRLPRITHMADSYACFIDKV
jgi:hypothetical protein